MRSEFHNRFRPSNWDEVLGHRSTVLSLKKTLDKGRSRAFLFTGPSGVGKTTLARLVAKHIGCSQQNIIEIDGAAYGGIDRMRELFERLQFATVDGTPRCVIVDESHAITRQAFQSLLKILEEPPADVYWCLCTTEADKIPKQIKTRCATYTLRPVPDDLLFDLLSTVKTEENLPISDEGLNLIVEASSGSPRQALVYLAECGEFRKLSSIRQVLMRDEDNVEAIQLCRVLMKVGGGLPWSAIVDCLKKLTVPPETVRLIVLGYMNKVMMGTSEDKARAAMHVASHFQEPFLERDGMSPLTMACAKVWAEANTYD